MTVKQKGRGNWKLLSEYLNANGITYRQYLKSEHWLELRARFWKSKLHQNKCVACGSRKGLSVHHKTYIRLGNERLDDLCLLCSDCHKEIHEFIKEPTKSGKPRGLWEATRKFIRRKHKAKKGA